MVAVGHHAFLLDYLALAMGVPARRIARAGDIASRKANLIEVIISAE